MGAFDWQRLVRRSVEANLGGNSPIATNCFDRKNANLLAGLGILNKLDFPAFWYSKLVKSGRRSLKADATLPES